MPTGFMFEVNPTPLIPTASIGEEALHQEINNMKLLLQIIHFPDLDRD